MLHYTKQGSGPSVVFLHGYGETSEMWAETIDDLKQDYTCIAIDLPGFGESKVKNALTMEDLSDAVLNVLAAENVDSYVLLGHSMGGYVGLELASTQPKGIVGLGLLHSTANADSMSNIEDRRKAMAFLEHASRTSYAKIFAPNLFSPENRSNLEWIDKAYRMALRTTNKGLQEAMNAMIGRSDRNHLFNELNIPYFFLVGRHDAMVPMNDMLRQAAACKRSMTCLLDDVGHLSMVENFLKYKQAVKDYLLWVYR
jgi:pimeloyl-ACP methyl ester carboxylesterase